jgi:sugar lactone lactonase YvrE
LVAIDLATRARTIISPSSASTPGATNFVAVAADLTGIALGAANDAVYVTRSYDPSNGAPAGILKIDLADGTRSIVTGSLVGGVMPVGSGPAIDQPHDVVVDTSTTPARLLVAHSGREVLAVDTTTGNRTTFSNDSIGTGTQVGFISRMRIDPANSRLLVTSGEVNQPHGVFAIDLATANRTQLIDSSAANEPAAGAFLMALDSADHHIYLANFPTTEIFRADLSGGGKPVLIAHNNVGTGYKPTSPRSIAVRGTALYFIDTAFRALIKVDAATGNRTILSGNGVGTGPSVANFNSLSIDDANGRALIVDSSKSVFAIDLATGNRTRVSSNSVGTGALFQQPTTLVWDAAGGRALVVDESNTNPRHAALLSVDQQGNRASLADLQLDPFPVAANGLVLDGPAGQPTSKALALLNGSLYGIDLTSGALTPYASVQGGNGMWIYPQQRGLLLTNGQNLSRYDFINAPEVVSGRDATGTVGSGIDLLYPNGVAADADANVAYVTDLVNCGIIAVDLTNGQRTVMSR